MFNDIDFEVSDTRKLFLKFLLPALMTVFVKSVLIVVDGIFIAQGVGPLGLAAMGLSMPIQSLFGAMGFMVALGGAATMSICAGKGDSVGAQKVFEQSLSLAIGLVATFVLVGFFWLSDIIKLLGATGELASVAQEYMQFALLFYFLHPLVMVVTFFVFNDRNPKLPMYSMIVGLVTHILLDYLFIFVFSMGMKGAALAAFATQVMMLTILVMHFFIDGSQLKLRLSGFNWQRITVIVKTGSPSLSLEIATITTMFIFNYILLSQYTELHLAAYGITMNIGVVLILFLGGIAQACQPIISYSYGAENKERIEGILTLGIKYSMALGLGFSVLIVSCLDFIIPLYAEGNQELAVLATQAAMLFFLAAPILGLNLIVTTFFQAISHPNQATIISIFRASLFVILGLFLLPIVFPSSGIWSLTLFAELMTAVISIVFLIKFKRNYFLKRELTPLVMK